MGWVEQNITEPISGAIEDVIGESAYETITGPGAALINPAVLGTVGLSGTAEAIGGGLEQLGEAATDVYHDVSGQTAAEAAEAAAGTQAAAMMEQLNYLKEINKLPQELREQALTNLSKIYGLQGTGVQQVQQQAMIDRAKASPYYQALVGGRGAGEEAIMRQASATGGLRSGDVQSALYDYNVQLEQDALAKAYGQQMGGLQGLAGLPTGEQQIGQVMGDIGKTQAAGILGGAQAQQFGTQNLMNLGLGIGGLISKFI